MTVVLTPMQEQAVQSIEDWFKDKDRQIFHLAGYAGTGKSTLVDYVINKLNIRLSRVAFACYTGKAALNLTQKAKGQYKAQTIHRLIYKLDTNEKGKPQFIKKNRSELAHLRLIVIDEWSMVDGETYQDLKSFGIKLLLIGDQGQLPPVGNSNNPELQELRNNPDFALTEIHRQAEGNPIIYLSMLARTQQPINYGWYGENREVLVINRMQWESVKTSVYTTADQIICGRNKTRQGLNKDIRQYLGFSNILPQKGDKLICTKNNWGKNIRDISLVNGMTGYVENIDYDVKKTYDIKRDSMELKFRPDFTDDTFNELYLVNDHFTGKEYKLLGHEYSIYSEFDFGYAITCHKSQGSQWEKVVVISEVLRPEEHHRWLYTAITRSSDKLVLVI
jgi:exodeoxyribonuclease V